jgi:lysozyme
MKTSRLGIDLIREFEGFKSRPYLDAVKLPTIGYGTTIYPNGTRVTMLDPAITEQKATEYLQHDVTSFEISVNRLVTSSLNQSQFDALVSFTYNLGGNNLKKSTLLKKVNVNPDDPSIRAEFLKWNKAGGKKLNGLTRRRAAESDLYFKN